MKRITDEELRKLLAEKYNCDIKDIRFETFHIFNHCFNQLY